MAVSYTQLLGLFINHKEINMTIGIIEDDKLLNQALDIALRKEGYHTVCTFTVREALGLADKSIDLFIIDIGFPDGNGIALYRRLREKCEVPAIFLTARDEEADMLEAFEQGAEDYVCLLYTSHVSNNKIEPVEPVVMVNEDGTAFAQIGKDSIEIKGDASSCLLYTSRCV